MKMLLEIKLTPFGIFVFKNEKLIKKDFWGKNPIECAKKFINKEKYIKKLKISGKRKVTQVVGDELKKLAMQNGFNKKRFEEFYQKFMIELTKLKLKSAFSYDKLIKQAVKAVSEIDKMINIMYERFREWYGYYYPEVLENIEKIEDFLRLPLERKGQSMGYDLRKEDIAIIRYGIEEIKNLMNLREKLTKYIEKLMNEFAPNISKVAGPILGAQLIAHAGSLEDLAKMPSSTIQVLGAEKALFRHLKKGTKPPKHGMILMHPMLRSAEKKERGKIARKLAAKIALAAKIDFYSEGKDENNKIKV